MTMRTFIRIGCYAAGLAYIVGQPFEDNHTAAFLVAFAASLTMTLMIEIVRHISKKRTERALAAETTATQ